MNRDMITVWLLTMLDGSLGLIFGSGQPPNVAAHYNPSIDNLVVPFKQQETGLDYRLAAGSECEHDSDCVGGKCQADPETRQRTCLCFEGTFRYTISTGLGVCLSCRPLSAPCSFDQECQCSDENAICDADSPKRKGHCICKTTFEAVVSSNGSAMCKTGFRGVQSACIADSDCRHITFADFKGIALPSPRTHDSHTEDPIFLRAHCIRRATETAGSIVPLLAIRKQNQRAYVNPNTLNANASAGRWDGELMASEAKAPTNAAKVAAILAALEVRNENTTAPQKQHFHNSCQCPDGFHASEVDRHICQDVDECSGENDPCNPTKIQDTGSVCINTIGSYRCECNSSFAVERGIPPSGLCCRSGFIPCLDASKCVPVDRLCDGIPDCVADCSDEMYPFCNFNGDRHFPDFTNYPQCHEEISATAPRIEWTTDSTTSTTSAATSSPSVSAAPQALELLPLGGASSDNNEELATPPGPLPTLPSNITAARLLGYTII